MRVVRLAAANELGSLCLTDVELFRCNAAAEQLVHEPEPVGVENIAFAVLRHFSDPASLNHRLDFGAINPGRLTGLDGSRAFESGEMSLSRRANSDMEVYSYMFHGLGYDFHDLRGTTVD